MLMAEKNKRKRERKKRERAAEQQQQLLGGGENEKDGVDGGGGGGGGGHHPPDVEIEYVAGPLLLPVDSYPPLPDGAIIDRGGVDGGGDDGGVDALVAADDDLREAMRRFHERSMVAYVTEDEDREAGAADGRVVSGNKTSSGTDDDDDDDGGAGGGDGPSKRKLKDILRPTVAMLKQRVSRPELVEAHDVTAPDPDFLIYLKGVPGTVQVPRHWGRKRKYLQGKRGVEKPPFALPDFIIKTGICDVRDATHNDEAKMSVKQKNRMRVSGRGGGVDVDYRTLYEAFFMHQTKPERLTQFGDLYYEGKEYENAKSSRFRPGYMSERLREALGMPNEYSPPPWLINMQRYGPPPGYPNARIPGLNAPLPAGASYGYHVGGWGKPPVDAFGRPLYGGDPFGAPEVKYEGGIGGPDGENEDLYGLSGSSSAMTMMAGGMITSDGKAIGKKPWGSLPNAFGDGKGRDVDDDDEGGEGSSSSEGEETSDDDEDEEEGEANESEEEEGQMMAPPPPSAGGLATIGRSPGMDSVLPDGVDSVVPSSALDLRKPGDETPGGPPKQLYTVLREAAVEGDRNAVFASDHVYVLPGAGPGSGVPEGAASVLSKSVGTGGEGGVNKRARSAADDDEADELGKKFKF
ncbi:hypothetical protein ACHAXA_008551 [Cyclostephanos tholiformis]|uniref:PSP proline-rich domain-containing protein n=1 Tax=Cyclostephanos tholiformis TaxID=382380 RepID=A0ABD3RAD8_9STRA